MSTEAPMNAAEEFNATTEELLAEMFADLAVDRMMQCIHGYARLMRYDDFIGSSVRELLPQISKLAGDEMLFIVAPSVAENTRLERERESLHAALLQHLTDAGGDLLWDDIKSRFEYISLTSWVHRGVWEQQRRMLDLSLEHCDILIKSGDMSAAEAERSRVLAMLMGTACTMIDDSGFIALSRC